MADIAVAWAARGDIALAYAVAERVHIGQYQAYALHAVFDALTRSGQLTQARELAERIPDPDVRARTKVVLALHVGPVEGRGFAGCCRQASGEHQLDKAPVRLRLGLPRLVSG